MFKSHPCGRTDRASLTSSARPQLSGTSYITFHVVMVADDCRHESLITGTRRMMLRREKLPIFGWASQVTAGSVSVSVWFAFMPQFLAHVVRLMKLSERALLCGYHLPGGCGWWDEVQQPAASLPAPLLEQQDRLIPSWGTKAPSVQHATWSVTSGCFVPHSCGHTVGFIWKSSS